MRSFAWPLVCVLLGVSCAPSARRGARAAPEADAAADLATGRAGSGGRGGSGGIDPTASAGAGGSAGAAQGGMGGGRDGGGAPDSAAAGTGTAMDAARDMTLADSPALDLAPDRSPDVAPDSAPGTGALMVTRAPASTTPVNLTAVGAEDWVHWGQGASATVNRKNVAVQRIAALKLIGPGLNHYGNRAPKYSWSDGTPTVAQTDTAHGVWVVGLNNGFEVTVNGTMSVTRTLVLYVGAYEGRAKLVATLSDGSAPSYMDATFTTTPGTGNDVVYTITFRPAATGALLKAVWTLEQEVKAGANVTIQAAALK